MKNRRPRRGLTLLEAGVAILVMSAAVLAVAELARSTGHERRARRQRHVAIMELANQAERIALLPYDTTSADHLTGWQPSPMLQAVIPQAACETQVRDEDGAPQGRRIELSVQWKNAAGVAVEPARLTVWRFARGVAP